MKSEPHEPLSTAMPAQPATRQEAKRLIVTMHWTTTTAKRRHKRRYGKRVVGTATTSERAALTDAQFKVCANPDLPVTRNHDKGCFLSQIDWIDPESGDALTLRRRAPRCAGTILETEYFKKQATSKPSTS